MRDYNFEILGSLPSGDAVAGVLSMPQSRAGARIVLVVPTEGLTDHKRREKIQIAKEELEQGGLIAFPAANPRALTDTFSDKAQKEIKASIADPAFIDKMLDVLTTETNNPFLVLDAQNRESFWGALRVMGAESADLFAVAELGALKPEAITKAVSKPIGEAHLLCGDLMKARGLKTNSDYTMGEYINMVRRSTKIKLPTIDLDEQILASHYLRDLETNTGESKVGAWFTRFVKLRSALQFIGREKPEIAVFRRDEMIGADKLKAMQQGMDKDVQDESYTRRVSDIPQIIALRGDPREVLTRKYKEHYQFDADQFDFDQLLQFHDEFGGEELRFRGGIHASPFPLALFETDMTKDIERNRVLTVATLVMQEGDTITAYNFIKPIGLENTSYYLHPNKMVVSLEQGRASNVAIVEQGTEKTLYSGGRLSLNNMGDMAFMHALSAIARMNEPDFAPTTYESRRRGLVDAAKGKFPYFDYVGMDGFGPTNSSVRIGPQGHAEEVDSKRRHLVRGHPRRLRDESGEIREIIMIPFHMRGDEAKGFVSKGYNLDK